MKHRSTRDSDKENLERWLLTYADLITLLLAFFVVMYSISRVDSKKYEAVTEALQNILRGKGPMTLAGDQANLDPDSSKVWRDAGDLEILQGLIRAKLDQLGLSSKISTNIDQRGLVIRVSESAFFDLGSADLRPEAFAVLDLISEFLISIPNHVRIEGYTDNLPISNTRFPSNWELSVTRATVCVRYLIERHDFPPDRISALGYGQYRPIAANESSEGRKKNRRVDIVVLNVEEKNKEPVERPEDISRKAEKNSTPVPDSQIIDGRTSSATY